MERIPVSERRPVSSAHPKDLSHFTDAEANRGVTVQRLAEELTWWPACSVAVWCGMGCFCCSFFKVGPSVRELGSCAAVTLRSARLFDCEVFL